MKIGIGEKIFEGKADFSIYGKPLDFRIHNPTESMRKLWATFDAYVEEMEEYHYWQRWLNQWCKPRIIYTNSIDERKER